LKGTTKVRHIGALYAIDRNVVTIAPTARETSDEMIDRALYAPPALFLRDPVHPIGSAPHAPSLKRLQEM
jgi:hypothetical protein